MTKKKKIEKKKYITYGIFYKRDRFMAIKNQPYGINKPRGGFWSSPINSGRGWIDWCKAEGFRPQTLDHGTEFTVSPKAKVLTIDSEADYREALKKYKIETDTGWIFSDITLDFEKILSDGYQGFHLTEQGFWDLRWVEDKGLGMGFYAWDCETFLVLDPKIIQDIKYFGPEEKITQIDKIHTAFLETGITLEKKYKPVLRASLKFGDILSTEPRFLRFNPPRLTGNIEWDQTKHKISYSMMDKLERRNCSFTYISVKFVGWEVVDSYINPYSIEFESEVKSMGEKMIKDFLKAVVYSRLPEKYLEGEVEFDITAFISWDKKVCILHSRDLKIPIPSMIFQIPDEYLILNK